VTSRTGHVTGWGEFGAETIPWPKCSPASRPKMPFPGAESGCSGVPGEGVATLSPVASLRPTTGDEVQPFAANRLRNCNRQITEGFSPKKVPKSTRSVQKWAVSV
jgi:hypothetical protein